MEFSYEVHYRTGVPLLKCEEQLFETLEHNQVRCIFLLKFFFFWITVWDFFQVSVVFIHFLGICLYQAPGRVPVGIKRYEHLFPRNLHLSGETDRGPKGRLLQRPKKRQRGCVMREGRGTLMWRRKVGPRVEPEVQCRTVGWEGMLASW